MSSTATITNDTVESSRQHTDRRWYRVLYSPLWLCLLAALLLRVWLMVRTQGVIDGDEALVGIQAERILHGVFPTYFYGIPYFGSLEAYLVAVLFAIFGPSVWVLRMEPLLLSLLLVYLTWRFAGALAEQAQLPAPSRRMFMTIAALLAALPPLYDGVIEMRTWGGWIEIFVLMLLLLHSTLRLTQRWQQGASPRELALRWAAIGFIVGLGLWVYPLITTAIIASALWLLGARIAAEVGRMRGLAPPCVSTLKGFVLALAAFPAAAIGFAPALIWGAANQWQNINFIIHLGSNGGSPAQRFQVVQQVWLLYRTCVAPRIIGGGLPSESSLLVKLHTPLLYAGTLGILAAIAIVLLSFFWHQAVLVRVRQLVLLPLMFAAASVTLFCLSSASTSGLMSCNADFAGRYATPLLLTLPFIFAAICIFIMNALIPVGTDVSRPRPADSNTYDSETSHTVGIGVNGTEAGVMNQSLPGHNRFVQLVQVSVFVLVLLYVGMQAFTYGLADPGRTFQSPYCSIAPANIDPIIEYMQQEHIRYAWATNFLAYPIVFKTESQIIAADPLPLIHPNIAINRIPAYTSLVLHADRPGFLVFVRHGDTYPSLLKELTTEGVTYRSALFPSASGVDVLVVTPLNKTVSPTSSKALDLFYCSM